MAPIPLPVIANTYRCALKWAETTSGQTAVNVIHIKANGSGTTASDAFHALDTAVTAAMWDSATTGASITEVDITPLDGTSGTISFSTAGVSRWAGSAGGDFIPAVAGLIKLGTPLRGRNHRGRIFLPFTAEAGVANGSFLLTDVTVVTNAWVAFQATLVGLSPVEWSLGVASYDRKNLGAGAGFEGINSVALERAVATQRRRQGRLR